MAGFAQEDEIGRRRVSGGGKGRGWGIEGGVS